VATSEVQICNSALIKVGAELILSLNDETKTARYCNHQYPILRDEVLSSHPWNFAIARKELAKTTNTPEYQYSSEFILPSDCLRVIGEDQNYQQNLTEVEWSVETRPDSDVRVLLANVDAIKILYIKRVTAVSLYSPTFVEVLATRLAADLSYGLVQSTSYQQQLLAVYQELLRKARSFDAQEGHLMNVQASEWVNSRF